MAHADTLDEIEVQRQVAALEEVGVVFLDPLPEHTSVRNGVKVWDRMAIVPYMAAACALQRIAFSMGDVTYR